MRKVLGFGSDGAAVMIGKRSGVSTRLRAHNPLMINIHCVAHRLAPRFRRLCTWCISGFRKRESPDNRFVGKGRLTRIHCGLEGRPQVGTKQQNTTPRQNFHVFKVNFASVTFPVLIDMGIRLTRKKKSRVQNVVFFFPLHPEACM